MIVFDLKCAGAHVFEAWFNSSAGFAEQQRAGLIACPICGDTDVAKAVMAPNVGAKGNRSDTVAPGKAVAAPDAPTPEVVKAAMAMLAAAQAKMLDQSKWVGKNFSTRARAMHAGDEPAAPIHGQATPEEARDLIDEGVQIAPLLVPIVPPDACN